MQGSAGDLQHYRTINVVLHPSITDQRFTAAVLATTVTGSRKRTFTLWRGQIDIVDGTQTVSEALASVITALREVSAVL